MMVTVAVTVITVLTLELFSKIGNPIATFTGLEITVIFLSVMLAAPLFLVFVPFVVAWLAVML